MACRAGNLRVLREAAFLLWEDGDRKRLRCDWCELMGETGWLTLDMLEREGALPPGAFVGIDLDPARIEINTDKSARWQCSFAFQHVEGEPACLAHQLAPVAAQAFAVTVLP